MKRKEINAKHWRSMEINKSKSIQFSEYRRGSRFGYYSNWLGFNSDGCQLQRESMKIIEGIWKSMKINKNQWKSMKTNGNHWTSIEINKSQYHDNQWKAMEINKTHFFDSPFGLRPFRLCMCPPWLCEICPPMQNRWKSMKLNENQKKRWK